jgi:Transposase IS66 family.
MIVLLKYGSGIPFYRLEKLQASLGIPLLTSTQWDKVEEAAIPARPVFEKLKAQASQGDILHNDDTPMKILELLKENKTKDNNERTGIFTTGILSRLDDRKIVIFLPDVTMQEKIWLQYSRTEIWKKIHPYRCAMLHQLISR